MNFLNCWLNLLLLLPVHGRVTGGEVVWRAIVDPSAVFVKEATVAECASANGTLLCEHSGRCVLDPADRPTCDCTGTGYTGSTCHFALYKQSCQELYIAGHRESGSYIIDVDRNGPAPPARVLCTMDSDYIKTTIVHSVPNELVVRSRKLDGFYINVTYRDFSPPMIRTLIGNSESCYQSVRYECRGVLLGLGSMTWMESTEDERSVYNFGGSSIGRCACSDTNSCSDKDKYCNCDSPRPDEWQSDKGNLTAHEDLAIAKVHFLKPRGLRSDAEARFWLGPLVCLSSQTQEQVITFTRPQSRLELDESWSSGDLSFSFRTAQEKAVILHQLARLRPDDLDTPAGHFKITLSRPNEIEFAYTVNGAERVSRLLTPSPLNSGDWQKVRVDFYRNQIRFTVNLVNLMIDLLPGEHFVDLRGYLVLAGSATAPSEAGSTGEGVPGFVGCFRALVVNNRPVDLVAHLAGGVAGLEEGCRVSCSEDGQPCQSGARCVELWGAYRCECTNPIAQSGEHCELDLNANAATFTSSRAFVHFTSSASGQADNYEALALILTQDVQIAFRTHSADALILYASDHFNNFVQLHVSGGELLIFTFNVLDELVSVALDFGPGLVSGHLVQLVIERSWNKTVLKANGRQAVGYHTINLLSNYSQTPWAAGGHLELVVPPRPPFPVKAYIQLFVAGVDGVSAKTNISGIIGCLQGLVVSGVQIDIMTEAERAMSPFIKTGCSMLCDSKPCAHGGACTEHWESHRTSCNCAGTSYDGESCEQDIGAKFYGDSSVRVSLPHLTVPVKNFIVQLAFSANASSWKATDSSWRVLMLAPVKQDYLLLALSSQGLHGSLLFEERSGHKLFRQVVSNYGEVNYGDGWRHWIAYARDGDDATLSINGEKRVIFHRSVAHGNDSQSNQDISSIALGTRDVERYGFEKYENFHGCLSNVLIKIDSMVVKPLEWAFTGGKNLSQVNVRGVKQGSCSEPRRSNLSRFYAKAKGALAPLNIQEWTPVPLVVTYGPINEEDPVLYLGATLTDLVLFVTCLVFLIAVLTSLSVYMCRLQRRYKLQKFQMDTPFFHARRRKSKAFPTLNQDQYLITRLLTFQERRASRMVARTNMTIPEEDEQFSDTNETETTT